MPREREFTISMTVKMPTRTGIDNFSNRVMFTLRNHLRPGDLGAIVALHGRVYFQERGFDSTFEAYVAIPLSECVLRDAPRERLWLADSPEGLAGCVGLVEVSPVVAQLRWFLVEPTHRRQGLGSLLIRELFAFARTCGYETIILWTESVLIDAARLYRSLGFVLEEQRPGRIGGKNLIEEKYSARLT